jgi:hypothetical protein
MIPEFQYDEMKWSTMLSVLYETVSCGNGKFVLLHLLDPVAIAVGDPAWQDTWHKIVRLTCHRSGWKLVQLNRQDHDAHCKATWKLEHRCATVNLPTIVMPTKKLTRRSFIATAWRTELTHQRRANKLIHGHMQKCETLYHMDQKQQIDHEFAIYRQEHPWVETQSKTWKEDLIISRTCARLRYQVEFEDGSFWL